MLSAFDAGLILTSFRLYLTGVLFWLKGAKALEAINQLYPLRNDNSWKQRRAQLVIWQWLGK
jgi:hypothetical protein